jgi:hypothetical protein
MAPAAIPTAAITSPFNEYPFEQLAGLRSDGQSHTELARSSADRKRQHSCKPRRSRWQGQPSRKTAKYDRVQPFRGEYFRANIFQRCGSLDRLVGCEISAPSARRWHERIRIRAYVDKQSSAAKLLLERMVDRHRRRRIDTLIIDVPDDTNDPPGVGTQANEFRKSIGPDQVPIDGVLARKQLVGDSRVDDHHTLCAISIRIREVAAR